MASNDLHTSPATEFELEARRGGQGMVREFASYLRDTRKWWLTPVVVMLVLLAALIVLGGSGAAPFIYTLF
jgi:hypothetical protein